MVRESIGVLPEDAGLYDRLTAREALRYYGRLHRVSGGVLENRIDELPDLLGLRDREKHKVATYSRGMRQKRKQPTYEKKDMLFNQAKVKSLHSKRLRKISTEPLTFAYFLATEKAFSA